MNIIIDAFGGDNAPLEVILGSKRAIENLEDVHMILVGDEGKIKACAERNHISLRGLEIVHTDSVIDICEEPTEIIKSKNDCSMAVGMKMLAEGKGDAFISAGSTGALVVGATFIVKRIKGIKRTAIATMLPTSKKPFLLIDAGANHDCRPEMLVQFAIMGSIYMEKIMDRRTPGVYLANIGEEASKGRELEHLTYDLLSSANVNFCGNVEARDLPAGDIDVCVTDGFTGNMLLKLYEGMGKMMSRELKGLMTSNFISKLGALCMLKGIKKFRKKMDYTEYGGAPLLGVSKPVIKAHGSSDANAFYHAIIQAKSCVESNVVDEISNSLKEMKV
ncbi:MAG: phosphate acyltransferase PlsX [Ruminococcus sp.]|nr:phosphate acyltransferase PlsX [Ruminococcus sp.]